MKKGPSRNIDIQPPSTKYIRNSDKWKCMERSSTGSPQDPGRREPEGKTRNPESTHSPILGHWESSAQHVWADESNLEPPLLCTRLSGIRASTCNHVTCGHRFGLNLEPGGCRRALAGGCYQR